MKTSITVRLAPGIPASQKEYVVDLDGNALDAVGDREFFAKSAARTMERFVSYRGFIVHSFYYTHRRHLASHLQGRQHLAFLVDHEKGLEFCLGSYATLRGAMHAIDEVIKTGVVRKPD